VLAVGELARNYLTGRSDERWFATVDDCLAALPGAVAPGSAVLVKASRAVRLERVAEALRKLADAPARLSAEAAPAPGESASDRARTVSQAFLTKQARRTQRRKNVHDKDA